MDVCQTCLVLEIEIYWEPIKFQDFDMLKTISKKILPSEL